MELCSDALNRITLTANKICSLHSRISHLAGKGINGKLHDGGNFKILFGIFIRPWRFCFRLYLRFYGVMVHEAIQGALFFGDVVEKTDFAVADDAFVVHAPVTRNIIRAQGMVEVDLKTHRGIVLRALFGQVDLFAFGGRVKKQAPGRSQSFVKFYAKIQGDDVGGAAVDKGQAANIGAGKDIPDNLRVGNFAVFSSHELLILNATYRVDKIIKKGRSAPRRSGGPQGLPSAGCTKGSPSLHNRRVYHTIRKRGDYYATPRVSS